MTSGGHTMTEGWNLQLQGRVRDLEADLEEAEALIVRLLSPYSRFNATEDAHKFRGRLIAKRERAAAQARDIDTFLKGEQRAWAKSVEAPIGTGKKPHDVLTVSADATTSPDAREAALRIVRACERHDVHAYNGLSVLWAEEIARALLSLPQDTPLEIAAIVDTFTDILSPETARKIASRIRSISPQGGEK